MRHSLLVIAVIGGLFTIPLRVDAGPFRRYPATADRSQKDVKPSSDHHGNHPSGERLPPKPPAFDPLDPPRTADAADGATKPDAAEGDVPKPLTDEPAAEPELPEPEELEGDEEEPYDGFFPKLNEQGIALELVYTGETMGLYRGGFNTRNAQKYRGNLDMVMTADLEKLGIGSGIFFIYGQNGHGRGMTERFLGDFQVLLSFAERSDMVAG